MPHPQLTEGKTAAELVDQACAYFKRYPQQRVGPDQLAEVKALLDQANQQLHEEGNGHTRKALPEHVPAHHAHKGKDK